MRWLGADECRIEEIRTVSRVLIKKTSIPKQNQGRDVECFCFKLSGASLHKSAEDSVLCETDTLLYIPRGLEYSVQALTEGPSIAVDFYFARGSVPPRRMRLFRPKDPTAVRQLFEEMYLLSAGVHPGDSYALLGRLYQMMATMENQLSGEAEKSWDGVSKIEPALTLIRKCLSDPGLSETQLAAACGYSVGYFRRVFTEVMILPPVRFIMEKRMERAASLLESGFLTVSEIAEQTGFRSVSYFSTAFSRWYGCSPTEWTHWGSLK